jgi:hypothetical protein
LDIKPQFAANKTTIQQQCKSSHVGTPEPNSLNNPNQTPKTKCQKLQRKGLKSLQTGTEALTTPWGHKPALHFEKFFFYSMHMLILEIRPTSIYHPIGTYYESTTCTSL